MHYLLTALPCCLLAATCCASDNTPEKPSKTEATTPVWSMPAPPEKPPQPPATQLSLNGRGESSDHSDNTDLRLMIATALNRDWRITAEWQQGKQQATTHPGPPSGDNTLGRVGLGYRSLQQELRVAVHQGNGVDSYHGWSLAYCYNVNSEFNLETQLARHDAANDSPELQLAGMKDQVSLRARWRHARYQLRAEASAMRFDSQTGNRIGDGNSAMLETGYQPLLSHPSHWLSLVVRLADYDAEVGAMLALPSMQPPLPVPPAGANPPPPPPPKPPAPPVTPKNAKEIGLVWTFGMTPEMQMPSTWHPIGHLGVSTDDDRGGGYQYLLGVEGPLLGHDRLRLGYGGNKNSQSSQFNQGQDELRQQLELRYQTLF